MAGKLRRARGSAMSAIELTWMQTARASCSKVACAVLYRGHNDSNDIVVGADENSAPKWGMDSVEHRRCNASMDVDVGADVGA